MADQIRVVIGGVTYNASIVYTASGSGASSQQVQGGAPAGAADSGNPVKVGGVYNATPPTLSDGQRGDVQLDSSGRIQVLTTASPLPAGTDRSGTATTSSGTLAAPNSARKGLNIQNIGANNIGVNEFGGTAAIGTAGTYTLTPGSSMNVRTNRLVTVIAATGATAYSATEF